MSLKGFFKYLFLIGGIALIVVSMRITDQVKEGELKLADAKEKVERIKEEISDAAASGADLQIKEGQQKIDHFSTLAMQVKWGGIALTAIGLLMFIFHRKKTT